MNDETMKPATGDAAPVVAFQCWMCVLCGFVYREEDGLPDAGIPPGMLWKEVPNDWTCPECGAGKSDFEMIEI